MGELNIGAMRLPLEGKLSSDSETDEVFRRAVISRRLAASEAGTAQAVTGGENFLFLFLSLRLRLRRIHLPRQREASRCGGTMHS